MPQNELQRLTQSHYEIMRLCLLGLHTTDIALAMKMTPVGVGLIINSPLFQDELAKRREKQFQVAEEIKTKQDLEAMDILKAAASDAANTHVNLLKSNDERVAQSSANSILDRVLQKSDSAGGVRLDEATINLLQVTINELKVVNLPSTAPPVERKDVKIAV